MKTKTRFFAPRSRPRSGFVPVSPRLRGPRAAARLAGAVAAAFLVLGAGRQGSAQSTPLPYSNYNWNNYTGMMNYNYDYSRYGLPGVGVSPFDPIVQAQLNLGLRTARYNMYNAWANQAAGAANLYNQQAIAQAMKNAQQQQQAVPPRYDVRQRVPRPVPPAETPAPKLLPRNEVLQSDGQVLWPSSASTSGELGQKRAAAEAAIRVAVKEFEASGKATIQSVAEAKSLLFAYGKPALEATASKSRATTRNLLKFFKSLEQVLDSLAGE
jgi:hypothetical protein